MIIGVCIDITANLLKTRQSASPPPVGVYRAHLTWGTDDIPLLSSKPENFSTLSCRSGIGEHLPFAHGFARKILIGSGRVA
jgi:hypothetical protein